MSFAHSWVLTAESCLATRRRCLDTYYCTQQPCIVLIRMFSNNKMWTFYFPRFLLECHKRLETVKLERQMMDGYNSKCYSVEPVLRCLPGCTPVRSRHIALRYNCMTSCKTSPKNYPQFFIYLFIVNNNLMLWF